MIRDQLAQLFIESEIFRVTNYRGLTKIMKNGVPGPGGLARQVAVGRGQPAPDGAGNGDRGALLRSSPTARSTRSDGDWQYQFLRTRANSIEGGTTDILKNIVAERVLGLPKLR